MARRSVCNREETSAAYSRAQEGRTLIYDHQTPPAAPQSKGGVQTFYTHCIIWSLTDYIPNIDEWGSGSTLSSIMGSLGHGPQNRGSLSLLVLSHDNIQSSPPAIKFITEYRINSPKWNNTRINMALPNWNTIPRPVDLILYFLNITCLCSIKLILQ